MLKLLASWPKTACLFTWHFLHLKNFYICFLIRFNLLLVLGLGIFIFIFFLMWRKDAARGGPACHILAVKKVLYTLWLLQVISDYCENARTGQILGGFGSRRRMVWTFFFMMDKICNAYFSSFKQLQLYLECWSFKMWQSGRLKSASDLVNTGTRLCHSNEILENHIALPFKHAFPPPSPQFRDGFHLVRKIAIQPFVNMDWKI